MEYIETFADKTKDTLYEEFLKWTKRNRHRIIISTAALVGGGVFLTGAYLFASRYSVSRKPYLLTEVLPDDRVVAHFETVQNISGETTLPTFMPQLQTNLLELINMTEQTDALVERKGRSERLSSDQRKEIWEELKILSFTRTVCSMWSLSLIDLFIKILVNILGRKLYFEEARLADSPSARPRLTSQCQHRFLAFVSYFPEKGLPALVEDCSQAVKQIVASKPLRSAHSVPQLKETFQSILRVFLTQYFEPARYVLPFDNQVSVGMAAVSSAADAVTRGSSNRAVSRTWEEDELLQELLEETRRVLYSAQFRVVLLRSVEEVLQAVMGEVEEEFASRGVTETPLIKLVPHMVRVGDALLCKSADHAVVKRLADLPEVKVFCKLVYSGNMSRNPVE